MSSIPSFEGVKLFNRFYKVEAKPQTFASQERLGNLSVFWFQCFWTSMSLLRRLLLLLLIIISSICRIEALSSSCALPCQMLLHSSGVFFLRFSREIQMICQSSHSAEVFYPPPVNSFVVLNMHCLTFLLWAIAFEILMRQPDLHGLPLPVKPKLSFARSELWNFHGMFISYFCFPPPSAAEPELLIDFCFPWSFLHIG